MIIFIAMDVVYSIQMDGKPKDGKHDMIVTFIVWLIFIILLNSGGFFN